MWIRAQFSDTSKRRECICVRCFFAVIWWSLLALASGCIVTDKIEFDDAINHPPVVQRAAPQKATFTYTLNEDNINLNFAVYVQDEDVFDSEDNPIDAIIEVRLSGWEEPEPNPAGCAAPKLLYGNDAPAADPGDPPFFKIDCGLDLNTIDAADGAVVEVRVIVSDLGFYRDQAVTGANRAEVAWFVQIAETAVK
jgi:hypothetical protein